MRNAFLGIVAFGFIGFVPLVITTPASAIEYPYCAIGVRGASGCIFTTREQCNAFVSGAGGSCTSNPRYPSHAFARKGRPRR